MIDFKFTEKKADISIDFEEMEKKIKGLESFIENKINNILNKIDDNLKNFEEENKIIKERIIENEYIKITKIEKPKHVVLYINYKSDILILDILKNIEFYINTKDNKFISIEGNYKSMLKFVIDTKDISADLLNPNKVEIKYRPNSKTHRIFIKKL